MNLIVVILLMALWALILLPGLLRARREASPVSSVDRFVRSMNRLASTGSAQGGTVGREVLIPASRATDARVHAALAARRRRTVLQTLGAVAVAATVLTLGFGGVLWAVAGVAWMATVVYVGMAVHVVWRRDQVRSKVSHLPREELVPDDEPPTEQRAAVGGTTVIIHTREK